MRQLVAGMLFVSVYMLKSLLLLLWTLKAIYCYMRILLIPWIHGFLDMVRWTVKNSIQIIHYLAINTIFLWKKYGNISAFYHFVRTKSQYISKLRRQQKNLILQEAEQYSVSNYNSVSHVLSYCWAVKCFPLEFERHDTIE